MPSPLPKNLDLKRCLTDYPYYAARLLKIKDKESNIVPLVQNEPQRKLQRVINSLRKRGLLVRVLELKARQEGMSTDAEGRLFHAAHMNENINARVIAHEEESGVEIFNMCKLFFEELPVPLQPMLRHESKKVLNFENPNAKDRMTNPGLRSKIQVLTAGKKSVARGMTIHRLHCCFGPDTAILTPGWGVTYISHLRSGDFVLDEQGQPVEVTACFTYDNDEPCVEVTPWCNSAFPLVMTLEHRLLTTTGLKPASALTEFDELVFPVTPITEEIGQLNLRALCDFVERPQGGGYVPKLAHGDTLPLSRDLGRVLGLYLAEGSLGGFNPTTQQPNRVTFSIHEDEVNSVMHILKVVRQFFDVEPCVQPRPDSKTCNVECNSALFGRFMYAIFSRDKSLPEWFMTGGRAFVEGLVYGYIYGDSNFRTQLWSGSQSDKISISSVRPQLTVWLRDALLSLGYGYTTLMYRGPGVRHGRHERAQHTLAIAGSTFRAVARLMGVESNFVGRPHVQKWRYSEDKRSVYIKIRSIEYTNCPTVHDVQVNSDSHLYLTGACISHNSEVGSWPFAEFVIPALMPTIPKTPESLIILESTAKGVGNFFHNEWLRAKEGLSNFYPFFLAWFDLNTYSREFNTPTDKVAFVDHFDDEEKELRRVYNLTAEQLLWRRLEIKDLGGDVEVFRQEYPANDVEAFLVSGSPIFDRRRLREYLLQCKAPSFVGDLVGKRLQGNERGNLSIWAPPEKGATYVMGIDVSEGGTYNIAKNKMEGDFSCIEIWRVLPFPMVAEQVAEYHGYTDPYALAEVTEVLGTVYNEALASVEVNACGRATQLKLQQTYGNCYIQEKLDRLDAGFKPQVGWKTDLHSKKMLIAFATHCISDNKLVIRSKELINECMSFIKTPEGTGQAAASGWDDRVMATMIALFTLNQTYAAWDLEDYRLHSYKSPADSLKDRNKAVLDDINVRVDLDIANILALIEPDHEDHWMNY